VRKAQRCGFGAGGHGEIWRSTVFAKYFLRKTRFCNAVFFAFYDKYLKKVNVPAKAVAGWGDGKTACEVGYRGGRFLQLL
jgi:hypothetical protein